MPLLYTVGRCDATVLETVKDGCLRLPPLRGAFILDRPCAPYPLKDVGTWRNRGREGLTGKCLRDQAGERHDPRASSQRAVCRLDVSVDTTAICVIDAKGTVTWPGKCLADQGHDLRLIQDYLGHAIPGTLSITPAPPAAASPRYGVTLLDDDTAVLAGVRFVGGTLWGDGRLAGPDAAPEQATGEPIGLGEDVQPRPVTGANQTALHRATRAVIADAIHAPDPAPLVVVTHHAPHPCCLPPLQRQGWIAGHTASDLSALTDAGRAALWIYGHIHQTSEHQRPGGTRLLCNAAGPRFHNRQFREDWVVEVPD